MGKMQWKLGGATLLVTFKNRIDQIFVKIYCSCSSTASDCYLCYIVPVVGQIHSKRESLFPWKHTEQACAWHGGGKWSDRQSDLLRPHITFPKPFCYSSLRAALWSMATLLCVCQEPGNTTRTHKEFVLYLQVQSRAPEPASRKRSYKEQDTADPKERQHAQPGPGKASHSQLLTPFWQRETQGSLITCPGEGWRDRAARCV